MRGEQIGLYLVTLSLAASTASWGDDGSASITSMYLARNGASAYQIVLAPDASPSEQFAAQELQTHFLACTGAELPIVNSAPEHGAPMIVVGYGPAAESLGMTRNPEELGEQGCRLRSIPPHLVIAGTPMAGTLYGVYDFLQEHLGVRWYAPGVTKIPEAKELPLPEVDRLFRPCFAWRTAYYAWPGEDGVFRARMRDNSGNGGPDNPQGIQYAFDGTCHSYFNYINPEEFFAEHPEYFSEIGGIRRRDETQLCLTNPEVLEIVTERILARMAQNPNQRQHNFSQMDYYNFCQCPRCREINEKYGTRGGTQFWFVNQLAERTAAVYPNKLIGTLAYMYTEEPPAGMEMHPNVAVWLCHMYPSCDSHPIATCPLNADYKRRAAAWSKICKHLYVWHYIVDFAHYYNPFPNFGAMAADLRFYRDLGVEGLFLQGMSNAGGGGEFSLLRPYYAMQLLWNPDQDPNALIRDFLDGYYGPAASPIHEYVQLLQDKVDQENIHMHLYTNPAQGYLTDEVLEQATALFDRAEAAVAGDAELLERVKVARMPLTYARFFPRNGYTLDRGKLVFAGKIAPLLELAEMHQRMQKHGFQSLREMNNDPKELMLLGAALSMPIDAPSIENEMLNITAVPFLGGRALQMFEKASGQCVTAFNTTRNLMFPFCGGEETRLGGVFNANGPFEQFSVIERTNTSITMAARCGGFELRRTLALTPGRPILTITARIANTTEKPLETSLRSHLELDLGDLIQTRVQFTNRRGETVEHDMESVIAGMREGRHYLDQEAPKDSWCFTGSKGLEVTQRFDEAQLDYTWLVAYPESLNELEVEVWFKRTTVPPGESREFTSTLEVQSAP